MSNLISQSVAGEPEQSIQKIGSTCTTWQHIVQKRGIIYLIVFLISVSASVASWIYFQPRSFEHPDFEEAAIQGEPDVDKERFAYSPVEVAEGYSLVLCAVPANDGQEIEFNFTNPKDNNVNLKVEVYDKSEKLLASTGVLKPGEYLKSVTLKEPLEERETPVNVRFMSYDPKNWTSKGNVNLELVIYKDYR